MLRSRRRSWFSVFLFVYLVRSISVTSPPCASHGEGYIGDRLVRVTDAASSRRFFSSTFPFRTAVPFWGQTTQISSILSPKRDRGPKMVKAYLELSKGLTLLEPQSRSGDNPVKFQVVLSPNGTAVLKWSRVD